MDRRSFLGCLAALPFVKAVIPKPLCRVVTVNVPSPVPIVWWKRMLSNINGIPKFYYEWSVEGQIQLHTDNFCIAYADEARKLWEARDKVAQ